MEIKTENWNGREIRFVWHEGEWWAVAKDVTVALEHSNTAMALKGLDEDEKGVSNVYTPGGNQEMLIVSELGIYELALKSRKKEAKEFKKWVKRVIKELRQQAGLEGFQVFRMMDKEHQKKAMAQIKETLGVRAERKHYIKANTVANKAISNKYGVPKMIPKEDMTPEMLRDRQPILEDAAQLTAVKEAYGLDFSVSKAIYKKWNKEA
jgi:prophage antirepressor-like protein